VLLLLPAVLSCKKDKPVAIQPPEKPQMEECLDIPKSHVINGYRITGSVEAFEHVFCNPLNKDEFAFILDDSLQEHHICIYNISTKTKRIVVNGNFIDGPRWSTTGWIAFTRFPDMQLWKIKSNGDSLKQLTNESAVNHFYYYPVWSPDGQKIICSYSTDRGSHFHPRIMDANGKMLKDLDGNIAIIGGSTWSRDGQEITAMTLINNEWKNCVLNINTYQVRRTDYGWFSWYPDSNSGVVWEEDGLYNFDFLSGALSKIKNQCESKKYGLGSISADGRKIILDRTNKKVIGDNLLYVEQDIVMMNSDGSNEEMLPLR
jgi:Tol biopolymer transport system component